MVGDMEIDLFVSLAREAQGRLGLAVAATDTHYSLVAGLVVAGYMDWAAAHMATTGLAAASDSVASPVEATEAILVAVVYSPDGSVQALQLACDD